MSGFFTKGMVLEQHKEPALSKDLRSYILPGSVKETEFEKILDPSLLMPQEILEVARLAEITDEHDGAPLYDKLRQALEQEGALTVVADAIDDEPFVSSQLNPLFKLSQQAVGGLLYAAKAVGSQDIQIAVYKNLYDLRVRIPNTLYGVRIKRITGKYPVEAREMFYDRKRRPQNVLLIGVGALIHLYRAVHKGQKQTTTFITVAGDCVGNPMNIEVTCGVPVRVILERCSLLGEPEKIVIGGPMTGLCITDPNRTVIEPTTRAILAFREDLRERDFYCIGCGKCADVCPKRLAPVYLYKAALTRHVRLLRTLDVRDCIGCGTCSYVCPARLDLSAGILRARHMLTEVEDRQQRQLQEQQRLEKEAEEAAALAEAKAKAEAKALEEAKAARIAAEADKKAPPEPETATTPESIEMLMSTELPTKDNETPSGEETSV